ncbi:MAG: hypothetical protein ACFFAS_20680 [Promethearchaeota archaeon]
MQGRHYLACRRRNEKIPLERRAIPPNWQVPIVPPNQARTRKSPAVPGALVPTLTSRCREAQATGQLPRGLSLEGNRYILDQRDIARFPRFPRTHTE